MPPRQTAFYDPFEAQQCLEQAAAPTHERLTADRASLLSWQTRRLLEEISQGPFDAELTVGELLRRCGLHGSHNQARFHREVGCSLGRYLAESRLETAIRLLRDSHLPVPDIAMLVGYALPGSFSDALERWTGLRPAELREKTRLAAARTPGPDPYVLSLWHRLRAGSLEPQRRRELVARLEHLYPAAGPGQKSGLRQRRARAAKQVALAVWERLVTLSPKEQRNLVMGTRFYNPELFHLLGKKSLAEGRANRRWGIFLARLALAGLRASREPLGDAYHDLRALGWARLGNAWRLANRHRNADHAFDRAAQAWGAERQCVDRRAEAEILWQEGNLRQHQRRFSESTKLVNRAIALCHAGGDRRLLVQCLVQRAALYIYDGQPQAALPVLREAGAVAREQPEEPDLRLFVLQALAAANTLAQGYSAAERLFPTVLQLCGELKRSDGTCQVRWLQGLVCRGRGQLGQATAHLRAARSGFVALRDMDSAAMVALDEAELCLQHGRTSQVVRLAAESIPVFEALELDREGLATLILLREAVAAGEVSQRVVREIRARFALLFPDSLVALREAGSAPAALA